MKKQMLTVSPSALLLSLSNWVGLFLSVAKCIKKWAVPKVWVNGLLFGALLSSTTFAQSPPSVEFIRLGTGLDDFPNESFSCIFQGSYGLMWFGTARGLLRYDGGVTRWYRHEPGNPDSLPAGNVRVLFEDSNRQLWVGANGGLANLNRKTGVFRRILVGNQDEIPLAANNIWTIQEDTEGTLWVGTAAGLFMVKDQQLVPCPEAMGAPTSGPTALMVDHQARLWLGTEGGGVFRFFEETGKFQAVDTFGSQEISSLYADRDGNIWVGTFHDGIIVIDQNDKPKLLLKADPSQPLALVSNVVHGLVGDASGNIWIATQNGLQKFDPVLQNLTDYQHLSGNLRSLRSNDVQQLFVGDRDLLWVATSAAGVDLLNLNQSQIQMNLLEGKACLAIGKQPSGQLILGTRGGVALVDPQTGATQWRLRKHTIRAVHVRSDQEVFVGTEAGLYLVRPEQDISFDEHLAFENQIWSIREGPSGKLWLASERGLLRFDPLTRTSKVFPIMPDEPNALSYPVATSLAFQDSTYLWIGTFGGGLNRLHLASGHFDYYQKSDNPGNGLVADDIIDLHIDTANQLWIATLSGGLHRWHPESETFSRLPLESTLHDQTPVAVASDHDGFLWLSTGVGLLRIAPGSGTVFRVRPVDGLAIGSALPGAILFHQASRELLVGGIEGLGWFSPENYAIPEPPPLLFTSFKAGQTENRHLLELGETIHLARHHKSFSLQFAVIDYLSMQEQEFAFQRRGIDPNWVNSTGSGEVNYTNLGGFGGAHELKIKGSTGNGLWQQGTFTTHVQPPLWLTWLPMTLFLVLAALVLIVYKLVSWREKKKRMALETKAQLADQRRILAESTAAIAKKERMLERTERRFQEEHAVIVQKFLERRSTEIANDLHDGPLGALHGLGFSLTSLNQKIHQTNVHEVLREIYETRLPIICKQLRGLCGHLLAPDFEEGLIAELESYVESTEAQSPGLIITKSIEDPLPQLSQDQMAVVFRIFRILLSNIEKHAKATQAWIRLKSSNHQIHLEIKDNGCGFHVPSSWESFKGKNHYGLYMVAYFARMMGGEFTAESKLGEGSQFIVAMPILKPS